VLEHGLARQQGVQLGAVPPEAMKRSPRPDARTSTTGDARTWLSMPASLEGLRSQASLNGNSRGVLPVNLATALAKAGASGGRPGSPMPVGGSALGTMCTAICGMSVMRGTTKSPKVALLDHAVLERDRGAGQAHGQAHERARPGPAPPR
jgi:hypothetical protein